MERDSLESYRDVVRLIAEDAVSEYPDPNDEGRHEYVTQSVDGSEWIIYTHYVPKVLEHTENEPDAREVQSMSGKDADWRKQQQIAAFMAMEADVWEEIGELDNERGA